MAEINTESVKKHTVIMEDRKTLQMGGIIEVKSFDDEAVVLLSSLGELVVRGEKLRIAEFDRETSQFFLEGRVAALFYNDAAKSSRGSALKRIFK